MNDTVLITISLLGTLLIILGSITIVQKYMVWKVIRVSKRLIPKNKDLIPLSVGYFVADNGKPSLMINQYPGVVFINRKHLEIEFIKDNIRTGGRVHAILPELKQSNRHKDNFWYIIFVVDGLKIEFLPCESGLFGFSKETSTQALTKMLGILGRGG